MTPEMIQEKHPDVAPRFLPSKWQANVTKGKVDWSLAPDIDGNWLGSCLICKGPAVYNFDRGVMKCDSDPSCHEPQRAVSIQNALLRLASE